MDVTKLIKYAKSAKKNSVSCRAGIAPNDRILSIGSADIHLTAPAGSDLASTLGSFIVGAIQHLAKLEGNLTYDDIEMLPGHPMDSYRDLGWIADQVVGAGAAKVKRAAGTDASEKPATAPLDLYKKVINPILEQLVKSEKLTVTEKLQRSGYFTNPFTNFIFCTGHKDPLKVHAEDRRFYTAEAEGMALHAQIEELLNKWVDDIADPAQEFLDKMAEGGFYHLRDYQQGTLDLAKKARKDRTVIHKQQCANCADEDIGFEMLGISCDFNSKKGTYDFRFTGNSLGLDEMERIYTCLNTFDYVLREAKTRVRFAKFKWAGKTQYCAIEGLVDNVVPARFESMATKPGKMIISSKEFGWAGTVHRVPVDKSARIKIFQGIQEFVKQCAQQSQ